MTLAVALGKVLLGQNVSKREEKRRSGATRNHCVKIVRVAHERGAAQTPPENEGRMDFWQKAPEIVTLAFAIERVFHYRREAHYDQLTGLLNRQGFFSTASRVTMRTTWSAIVFDTDKFKHINDQGGHLQGDAVLRQMAELAHAIVLGPATNGLASRTGGDEFTLLLPLGAAGALKAAECLRRLVVNHEFAIGRRVTVSVGVATALPGESLDSVCSRADGASYAAKKAGGNLVSVATAAPPASPSSRVRASARAMPRRSRLARFFVDLPRALWRGTGASALKAPIRLLWSNLRKERHTRRATAHIGRAAARSVPRCKRPRT